MGFNGKAGLAADDPRPATGMGAVNATCSRWSVASVLLIALAGCVLTPRASVEQEQAYFSPARLARLNEQERSAWPRYLAASAEARKHDQEVLQAEVASQGHSTWIPAGDGPVFELDDSLTADWFAGSDARKLADAVVSYQTPSGGWSKRVDLSKSRR